MKKLLFSISILGLHFSANAQDIYYSNHQQSLLSVNPSFVGSNGFIRMQANHRSYQDYFSNGATFDMYLKRIRSGVAFVYNHEDIGKGKFRNDVLSIIYSRYFYLGEKKVKLIPSLGAGIFIKQVDPSKITFEELWYGRYSSWAHDDVMYFDSRKINFDASAGLMLQSKNFILGSSVYHITQPDGGLFGVRKIPARFIIHSSYNLIFSEKHLLNVTARYIHQQKYDQAQLVTNAVLFRHYVIGLGYQTQSKIYSNIGFHHHFFNVILTGVYDHDWETFSAEIGASHTLRPKDQRKQLVAMENW